MGVSVIFNLMPDKIYRLSLDWKPVDEINGLPGLEVLLDGVPLLKMLQDWESTLESDDSKKVTLGHGPIIYWHSQFLHGWLNEKIYEDAVASPAKASVLGCTCGELGCNPLEISVTLTEETVTWSDFFQFFQSFRPDYIFAPLTFHRDQYEAEVRRAISTAPA